MANNSLCGKCKKEVRETDKGVACDVCGTWYHSPCGNVSQALYKAINARKGNTVCWYCDGCAPSMVPLYQLFADLKKNHESLKKRVDKIEDGYVTKEEIPQEVEKELQKESTKKYIEKVVKESESISSEASVHMAAREAAADIAEAEKRKNNLIIHKLEESKAETPDEQKEEDMETLLNVLKIVDDGFGEDDLVEATRLGAKAEDKIRPVLVKLNPAYDKMKILREKKKLREANNQVGISEDLPKGTREYRKTLIDKARKEKGQEAKNFIFYITGRPGREKVNSKVKT